jgi:ABC-2 type transport system permease protein
MPAMRSGLTWIIARHELRVLTRGAAARAIVFLTILLSAVALIAGVARARADADDRAALDAWSRAQRAALAAEALAEDTTVGAAVWGPRSAELIANERGTYAVAPAAPLAALTIGESDRHPSHYRVTARLREAQLTATHLEHPLALVTGHLDLSFIVIFFLPLAIIALGYDLTAEERRTGTLRMVLARPLTLRSVVFGKLLARALAVFALAGVIAVGAALGMLATSGVGGLAQALVRLTWWNAVVIAYAAFWLALTVYVDARGRSASANALVLATVWLITVVLTPAAIALTANAVHPAPSGVQLATAIRAATHAAAVETGRELGAFLEDHPTSGVGRSGMQQYAALQNTRETMIARRLQPTLTAFAARRGDRRAFSARLQYLSPAMLAQFGLAEIAGTGERRRQVFESQAVTFQQVWKNFFAPRLASARPLDAGDYGRMPLFNFEEEPAAAIARRVAAPFAVLMIAAGVLLGMALRRYGTYQP